MGNLYLLLLLIPERHYIVEPVAQAVPQYLYIS